MIQEFVIMAPVVRDRFAQLLRDARDRRGVRQEDISERLGIDRSLVSQWERGDRKSPLAPEHVNKLALLLDVSVLELVIALGYEVEIPGIETEEEATLLHLYREAHPEVRRVLLEGLRQGSQQGRRGRV